jgi:hypothetical protein
MVSYKTIPLMIRIQLLTLTIIILSACSVEKRLHNPGWHIQSKKITSTGSLFAKDRALEKLDLITTATCDTVSRPVANAAMLIDQEEIVFQPAIREEQSHPTVHSEKKLLHLSRPMQLLTEFSRGPVTILSSMDKQTQQHQYNESRINWGKIVLWVFLLALVALAVFAVGFSGPGPNYAALILILILAGIIIWLIVLLFQLVGALLFDWWV